MKPIVHRLEADYWGQIDFVYIDREADQNEEVVKKYGVFGQPIFLLLKPDGTVVQRWAGAVSESDLRQALDGYLSTSSG